MAAVPPVAVPAAPEARAVAGEWSGAADLSAVVAVVAVPRAVAAVRAVVAVLAKDRAGALVPRVGPDKVRPLPARAQADRVLAGRRRPEDGQRGIKTAAPTGRETAAGRIGGTTIRVRARVAGVPTAITGTGIRTPIAGAQVRRGPQAGRVRAERRTGRRVAGQAPGGPTPDRMRATPVARGTALRAGVTGMAVPGKMIVTAGAAPGVRAGGLAVRGEMAAIAGAAPGVRVAGLAVRGGRAAIAGAAVRGRVMPGVAGLSVRVAGLAVRGGMAAIAGAAVPGRVMPGVAGLSVRVAGLAVRGETAAIAGAAPGVRAAGLAVHGRTAAIAGAAVRGRVMPGVAGLSVRVAGLAVRGVRAAVRGRVMPGVAGLSVRVAGLAVRGGTAVRDRETGKVQAAVPAAIGAARMALAVAVAGDHRAARAVRGPAADGLATAARGRMTGVVPAIRGEARAGNQIRVVLTGVAALPGRATSAVETGAAATHGRMTSAVPTGEAVRRQAAGDSERARKGTAADTATGLAGAVRPAPTVRGQRAIGTGLIDGATVVMALGGQRAMPGTGRTAAARGPGLDSAVRAGRTRVSPADRGERTGRGATTDRLLGTTMTSG